MTQPPDQQQPGGFGAPQEPTESPQTPAGPPPAQPPVRPPAGQSPAAPTGPPPAAPQQPGYGYPQAPGQAPGQPPAQPPGPYGQQIPGGPAGPYNQQPGPYGAPAQPGPYGQQPGPYGQPQPGPYGAPTQPGPYGQPAGPGYGYPPQYPGAPAPGGPNGPVGPNGPGGRTPFKGRPAVIIGAAVAALLVVGTGVWLATSGGDDDKKPVAKESATQQQPSASPSVDEGDGSGDGREAGDDLNAGRQAGEAKVLWLQKNDVDLPRNGAEVFGPWVVGDVVAKAMYRQVSGYSVTDGKRKWTLPLPADICAAPPQVTADGKVVIGLKNGTTDKADCADIQMIDLKTGKPGWKKSISKTGIWDMMTDIGMAISGDTVTVGRTSNSNAYRVSDGKELFGTQSGSCQRFAYAGGPRLIAASSCKTADLDKPQHQLQDVDPVTGKARWTYRPPVGWEVDKVYSVSPLVVGLTQRTQKKWSVIAIKENGTLRSQIDGGKDKFSPRCAGRFAVFGKTLEGCVGVAADANTFYMSTQADTAGRGGTNKVVAFSLNTGKPKWRADAPKDRVITPLRMEGGNVLLYVEASYDRGGAVATLAPTGGAPEVVLQHPDSTAAIEASFYDPAIVYAGGRTFIASHHISAANDKAELETKTMMAFGN
ncbi:PQQ-binding-like beta-propeller repeat protein [Streptomyces sp. DT24]|uniref:outer membrane protein assembly factor BamB family protein n=1 Tax=Streptomyces sp. DT24 TaxID=3416520 RepID=UPI003CECE87E